MSAVAALLTGSALVAGTSTASAFVSHDITANVTDGAGNPLDHFSVEVLRSTGDGFLALRDVQGWDGQLDLSLPDGDYKIGVSADGYNTEWYADAASAEAAQRVPVVGADVALSDIKLDPKATIVGTVTTESGPLSEGCADVAAYTSDGGYAASAWVFGDGSFTLADLDQGQYTLHIEDGCGDNVGEWYGDVYTRGDAEPVDVPATGVVPLDEIVLSDGSSIAGTVRDTAGQPIQGVWVSVSTGSEFGDGYASARTAADGTYRIGGLGAGDFTVSFNDGLGDYEPLSKDVPVTRDTDVKGFDAQLSDRSASTPGIVTASGIVRSTGGAPLAGIWVSAFQADGTGSDSYSWARTNRKGEYRFDGLPAGSYKFAYNDDSYDESVAPYVQEWYGEKRSFATATPVTVSQTERRSDLDVVLAQFATVNGLVSGPAGKLVNGNGYVTAYDVDGEEVAGTSTDANGAYRLHLEPGTYRFKFEGHDEATESPYLREWYSNGASFSDATPITLGDAEVRQSLDATLSQSLEAGTAPQVSGTASVGSTLFATPGRWTLMRNAEFDFQWLRDGVEIPGANGSSRTVTAQDAGHKLGVRVTATVGDLSGSALSAQTAVVEFASAPVVTPTPTPTPTPVPTAPPASVVKRVSSLALAATSPKKGVARVVVTLKVAGVTGRTGKVTLKDGSKVKKTVSVLKGKAVVILTKQAKGKHVYSAVYGGSTTVKGSTSSKVTLRVK